jgi:hypothetical protein
MRPPVNRSVEQAVRTSGPPLRFPVLNRALSWPFWPPPAPSLPRCAVPNRPGWCCRVPSNGHYRISTLAQIVPVVTAVDPSVTESSTLSYPLVDRNAIEPPAIRPSLQQFHRSHRLLRQYGRCLALRQEHSVKCRSILQHRHNSVIVIEDIKSLARKLIMIFRNMR